MGRFYDANSTAPQFVDGLYTPPWELINKKIEENQQGYDNVLATTNLFNDIDIQHIEDPVVKDQVQKIKDYYTGRSNQIVEAIKADPMNWRRAAPDIQSLSRQLQKDMKSGDIAEIQNQYSSLAKFVEDNKEMKNKHPELYNQALNYYLTEWKKDPLRKKSFDYDNIVGPIDMDALNKQVQAMKENVIEHPDKSGMYIVGDKGVSKDRVEEAVRNYIYGRPENQAYLRQQLKFQDPDYYNKQYADKTGGSGLYEKFYTSKDAQGNDVVLSDEEASVKYQKYQSQLQAYMKGKRNTPPPTPDFQEHRGALARMMDEAIGLGAHNEHTMKANSAVIDMQIAKMKIASEQGIANARLTFDKSKQGDENRYKAIGQIQKQAEIANTAIDNLLKNTTPTQKNDPVFKEKIANLEKQKADALTKSAQLLGIEQVKADTRPMNASTTKASFGAGEDFTKYLLFDPGKAKAHGAQYDANSIASISLGVPQTLSDLRASAVNNPDSRDSGLYTQVLDRISKSLSDSKVDGTTKSIAKRFLEYSKDPKHGVKLNSEDLNDDLDAFLENEMKSGRVHINSTEGAKFNTKKYTIENYIYGEPSTESMPRNSRFTPEENKDRSDFMKVRKALQKYKTSLYNSIVPSIKSGEDYLKSMNQVKQYSLVPVSDWGSKQVKELIKSDKGAFSIYVYNEKTGAPEGKPINMEDGAIDATQIKTSVISAIRNGNNDAMFATNNNTKYIILPASNGYQGEGKVGPTLRNVMTNPQFTTAKGNDLRYIKSQNNAVVGNIFDKFATAPSLDRDIKIGNNEQLNSAKGSSYSVDHTFYTKDNKSLNLKLIQKNINGQTYYNAVQDGEIVSDKPFTSLEAMVKAIQSNL